MGAGALSVEFHVAALGQAGAIADPYLGLAGSEQAAADLERLGTDQRAQAAIGEATQARLRIGPAERAQGQVAISGPCTTRPG